MENVQASGLYRKIKCGHIYIFKIKQSKKEQKWTFYTDKRDIASRRHNTQSGCIKIYKATTNRSKGRTGRHTIIVGDLLCH